MGLGKNRAKFIQGNARDMAVLKGHIQKVMLKVGGTPMLECVIPALVNELINLIKESALISKVCNLS